ncbi:hypothetical protein MMC14_003996 [Varicellaria rhodocarpa]|nr:hypothetical protein [Varicellaria rhodocarpa]
MPSLSTDSITRAPARTIDPVSRKWGDILYELAIEGEAKEAAKKAAKKKAAKAKKKAAAKVAKNKKDSGLEPVCHDWPR